MISNAASMLSKTGIGGAFANKDKVGLVQGYKALDKTLLGSAAQSETVQKAAKKTVFHTAAKQAESNARKGLQNVRDDY